MSSLNYKAESTPAVLTIGERSFPLCCDSEAVDFARILLGCYRKIDAEDVSVFTRGVVATLAAYPAFAARSACDPIRGLPSRLKWPPTLAEIRAACEAELDPYRREAAARARLAPRRRRPEATPEERARVLQGLRDLSARLGATSRSRAFG